MINNDKKNGRYYTSEEISDFMVTKISERIVSTEKLNILEPSCGDGVFIKSINKNALLCKDNTFLKIIDINKKELNKTKAHAKKKCNVSVHCGDFLKYSLKEKNKYDIILGNPPYINRIYIEPEKKELCNVIQGTLSSASNTVHNIWPSFVIASTLLLKDNGIMAFVLPSELLQVNYASELRDYLIARFPRIEVFTFSEHIFADIEQNVILLFCYGKSNSKGLYYYHNKNVESLKSKNAIYNYAHSYSDKKWKNFVVNPNDCDKIDVLAKKMLTISDLCTSATGIVTAANKYFILSQKDSKKHNLQEYCVPILQKSNYFRKGIDFKVQDYEQIVNENKPTELLVLKDSIEKLNFRVKMYLEKGIDSGIHKRFKCKNRKPWYKVQSLWKSEGVFFKRSHLYPKILVNSGDVYVTDTGYRITMKENYDIYSLCFCFYNSLTLYYSELYGRAYGGGVLELTPMEFKRLPIPYCSVEKSEFSKLDKMFRDSNNINDILNYTDTYILKDRFGFTEKQIKKINTNYNKLVSTRIT